MGHLDISILGSINMYLMDRRGRAKCVYSYVNSVRKVALLLSVSSSTAHRWNPTQRENRMRWFETVQQALFTITLVLSQSISFFNTHRTAIPSTGTGWREHSTDTLVGLVGKLSNPFRRILSRRPTTWLPSKSFKRTHGPRRRCGNADRCKAETNQLHSKDRRSEDRARSHGEVCAEWSFAWR